MKLCQLDADALLRLFLLSFKQIYLQGGPKKWRKVYGTIILQLYITESCGFQQNVRKEIFGTTRVSA